MNNEATANRGSLMGRLRAGAITTAVTLSLAGGNALQAQSVTLAWNPSTNNNLAGYTVLYGFDGTNFPGQSALLTNTSVTVTGLPAGAIVHFKVVAQDVFHNVSPPSAPVEYFVINDLGAPSNTVSGSVDTVVNNSNIDFSLLTSGPGTISPTRNAKAYQIGKAYTLTAVAAKGAALATWTSNGVVVATTAKYTVTVAQNLAVQANFVTNSFLTAAGAYHGLFFDTNNPAENSAGSFTATVTSTGAYNAKICLQGQSHSFTGQFSSKGVAVKTVTPPGVAAITVQLELNLLTNGPMTGTLSNANWVADMVADPVVYSKANPAPEAGKYTLVFPGSTNASMQPGGNGFAAVTVTTTGAITLSGNLGDGTPFSSTSVVSSNGAWPFYVSLYGGKGSILGWLSFTNDAISGEVGWIKLPQTSTKLYPGGFTNTLEVLGSAYQYTNGQPLLDLTQGQLLLTEGNLTQTITNQVDLTASNEISDPGANKIIFRSASGLFKGTVTNPETGEVIAVNGIVLQNQDLAAGFFLGASESGNIILSPTN